MNPSGGAPQTIFRTLVMVALAPFVDGTPVDNRFLASHRSLDGALSWIGREPFGAPHALDAATERLLFFTVTERALDVGPSDYRGHVALSPAGEVLEQSLDDEDEPWNGRDAGCCEWQRGDVAACVDQGCYRVGVVLALPPSVERARNAGLTRSDDVYLLAFGEDDFSHAHPQEAQMFEPLADVPEDLWLRFERRLQIYPGEGGGSRLACDSSITRPRIRRSRESPARDAALLPSERRRKFPVCCLQSDVGFILCSIPQRTSGADADMWFSEGEFMRHPSSHGPRILVMPGQKSRSEGLERAVQVRLTSPPEMLGTLPGELAQQVVQFVEKNRDLLLRYWKGGMSTLDAYNLMARV